MRDIDIMEGKSKGKDQYAIFKVAVKGEMEEGFFEKYEHAVLLCFRTPDEDNSIVHIAARHGQLAVVKKAVNSFPDLLRQKNNYGNTPLHEAAAFGRQEIVQHLIFLPQNSSSSSSSNASIPVPCLMELNHDGDTPFHIALRSRNMTVAQELFSYVIEHHPEIMGMKTNLRKETPLHLFVRCCPDDDFLANKYLNEGSEVSKQALVFELIETNFWSIFEVDSEGFNPLMRAAQYGRVLFIYGVLLKYPLSMECRDSKGRSFLGHLRLTMTDKARDSKDNALYICQKILEIQGVDEILTCSRDKDGNTPLHLAILDREFDLAKLILKRYVAAQLRAMKELVVSIKNTQGNTVFDLITCAPSVPQVLKNLMEEASRGRIMRNELYNAAKDLDVGVFTQHTYDDDDYLSQDVDGKNILHLAVQTYPIQPPSESTERAREFIREAIERYPKLMYQKDCNGDTPLHIGARRDVYDLIVRYFHQRKSKKREDDEWLDHQVLPWRVKDSRGLTPFHEAVRYQQWGTLVNTFLFERVNRSFQTEALCDVNEYGETAYQLIAQHGSIFPLDTKIAAYNRDVEGLTPILKAARRGKSTVVEDLSKWCPKSINICDYKGRNVLHHLCTSASTKVEHLKHLIEYWESEGEVYPPTIELTLSRDEDGNSPLHLAIFHQNFEVAHSLITHHGKGDQTHRLTRTINNQGEEIKDLITCGIGIPQNLKKLIQQIHDMPFGGELKMDDHLYEAVTKGDVDYVKRASYDVIHNSRSHDGGNVMHVALRHHQLPVTEYLVNARDTPIPHYYYYPLIYERDSKGDTPLHLAAGLQTNAASTFLDLCLHRWSTISFYHPPWKVRNAKGNTYLHEAARVCNYNVIFSEYVIGKDIQDVDALGETVLHVLVKYATESAKKYLEDMTEQMQSLVYIQDFEGFTPVLRALQYGRLGMAMLLVQQCPRSAEIPDNKGRTILHHLRALVVDFVDEVKDILPVWNEFFKRPGVDQLRIAQNVDGNTPLHLAIIEGDFTKAKFLMEKCLQSVNRRELVIVNNDGHLVFELVSSRADILAMKELQPLVSRRYVNERNLIDKAMDDELYQAAMDGNTRIFDDPIADDAESRPPNLPEAHFCRQTPGGSNIIHIALRHGKENKRVEEFIKIALEKHPILSMQPENNGDTPLHLAVKWKSGLSTVKLLIKASENFLQDESKKAFHVAPWARKNYKGSFPIHEALQTGNLKAAYALLDCDTEAANRISDLGDTALHSLAKTGLSISDDDAENFMKKLFERSKLTAYMRDNEGLTALLSGARSGRLQVVRAILKYWPQSAYLQDPSGRTFLHLLRFTGEDVDESLDGNFKKTGKQLFEIPEADAQRLVQDFDGNTPLHYAIINKNSIAAIVLTLKCLEDEEQKELGLVNKEGQTIPDLLALHDVPYEIIELIQKKVPEAVYLARSSYGIRKTEMKESANALSVVAALLATITFAAAFQVPGGFGDDGFPILLQSPAFAIFSLANTIAMCSSMLCLFLLLWVMGIGKIHGSLKVLDISIILLRLSFYLTLLTFTTGMFVTTVEKSLWLGILTCVLGFLTFLLTFKFPIKIVAKCGGCANNSIKEVIKFIKSHCKPAIPSVANTERSDHTVTSTIELND